MTPHEVGTSSLLLPCFLDQLLFRCPLLKEGAHQVDFGSHYVAGKVNPG